MQIKFVQEQRNPKILRERKENANQIHSGTKKIPKY